MSQNSIEESSKSRARSIRNKRSFENDSKTSNHSRKRRRKEVTEHKPRASESDENQFTALAAQSDLNNLSEHNQVDQTSLEPVSNTDPRIASTMASPSLGRNRLAMGFSNPKRTRQGSKSSGEISSDPESRTDLGQSSVSPIEISDDEMEESEGGMVINLDEHGATTQLISSDETRSEESGEIVSTPREHTTPNHDSADLFVVDPTPSIPVKRLVDLTSIELEEQLKYAFFYLDRDQIDLSRPAICLACFKEGHLHYNCEPKTSEPFPTTRADDDVQIKLWISCCICASKSHLVGDCPHLQGRSAKRWSLKAIRPEQIINLSLQSGISKMEKEAENKNMRPTGLQIKGRAGLHNAGVQRYEDNSDDTPDEPFLRKPVGKRQADIRIESPRSQRYDRYDPPSGHQGYRGGGQWYATDSFGRRRSHSPDDRYDSYRPRGEYGESRNSPQRDSWRPPPTGQNREQPRSKPAISPRQTRAPTAASKNRPTDESGSNSKFSLPTRKGSNPWPQNDNSGTSTPTSGGKSKEKSKFKRGRRAKNRFDQDGQPN